ncbi:kinase-like domain-containing protein [Mycena floridula]|nr:kinase-like domain-containing protein [Mycena floridula]
MGAPKYPKIGGFEIVKQIGGGGFSTVYQAVNISQNEIAACKLIAFNDQTTEQSRKAVEKEIKVHSALHHEYVLRFINAIIVETKYRDRYVPGIYILLELAAGGDLFDKIVPDVGLGDEIAQVYFKQLVAGIDYIHKQGVCHRDLKPENILLDGAGTLKISDFGLSSVFMLKETGKTRRLSERCGSLPYVAPELSGDASYEAQPIDIWGIGVILYTLLAGNTPWDEPTLHSPEYKRYLTGEIFEDAPWSSFGEDALSLLRGLLHVDPSQRWSMSDIAQHVWCTRPSQLQDRGSLAIAERLTQPLFQNGDMAIAAPDIDATGMTIDEDEQMLTASHQTQFTQKLMLFSQTQSGVKHTPGLTRFYSSLEPSLLSSVIQESLATLNVQYRSGDKENLRIGGYDSRRLVFKGWVMIESFTYRGSRGSFCTMNRDEGNPISWRQLWKALILSPNLERHVLKKQ